MLKFIISITLLFAFIYSYAQSIDEPDNPITRKERKKNSEDYIVDLKNGALLVRLHDRKQLRVLIEKGIAEEKALRILKEQESKNQALIDAFHSQFSFCPFYFFYTSETGYVKRREFDKVNFINREMEIDSSIHFNYERYLIAEITSLENDTLRYRPQVEYVETENGLERRSEYRPLANNDYEALVMRSPEFVQLYRPFPFHVRTYSSLPLERNYYNVVHLMNKQLRRYFKSVVN